MNKIKTNEQILKAFKKSNKLRRQRMAENAGFRTTEEYRSYLDRKILVQEPIIVATPPVIPVNNNEEVTQVD